MAPRRTVWRSLRASAPGPGGYRTLAPGDEVVHLERTELAEAPGPSTGPAGPVEVLLTVAHLSDLHVCDTQSPARIEFLNRWADPDSPILDRLGEVGTWRAQELMTTHVAEAMVRAVNAVTCGPVGGAALDLAIATGDNTDNSQANELSWYIALLEGGRVHPDSGDPDRYEGVADDDVVDERYWHPHGDGPDLARKDRGFPLVPGLLDAVRAPFTATGLAVPWLAVHGNHDRLMQGTVPGDGVFGALAVGSTKPVGLPSDWSDDAVADLFAGLAACDPDALTTLAGARRRTVTPDPQRRMTTREEFVAAHFGPRARPRGHGFDAAHRAHYRHDHGRVTLLVLDTVDEFGGWEGSLDAEQVTWLDAELTSADEQRRYVVLASHHPLRTLINDTNADGAPPRALAAEVEALLARHRSVVLWLNGHTHDTTVVAHGTWWEVTAPSLIDWPQQGRVVEVLRSAGVITVAATMLDHAGSAPWDGAVDDPAALAGLSRELAANDWQWLDRPLEEHARGGRRADRNVLLHLPDPWPGEL